MAPEKGSANTDVTATGKMSTAQRTIASFFGTKSAAAGASKKNVSLENTKEVSASIASRMCQPQPQPQSSPAKRSRAINGKGSPTDDGQKTAWEGDADSPGTAASKKSKDWISTPSPSEPAKPGTKTFGRRDRKALKSGIVVTPVSNKGIEKSPEPAAENPELIVGKRLQIFWPLDKVWYSGRVKSYNEVRASHLILYDDGEEELLELEREKVKWLDETTERDSLKTAGRGPSKQGQSKNCLDETNSRPFKRKTASSEEVGEDEDSLMDELKNDEDHDEIRSGLSKGAKRIRSEVEMMEYSPAKVSAVSADVCDDVDIGVPMESKELKVRKRLRRVSGRATEGLIGVGKDTDLLDLHEEESQAEQCQVQKAPTSARRLKLIDSLDHVGKLPSTKSRAGSTLESLGNSVSAVPRDSDTDKSPTEKTGSIPASSLSKRVSSSSERSQGKDFFSKLSAKSSKDVASSLPLSSARSNSPASKDIFETPAVPEADQFSRGELHSTLVGEAAERFGGRVEEKFKFLGKGRRDGSGRRPSDPDYDPRTVLLPPEFLKGLSGGQRQWWEFKCKHMDKVLFFKMGKFYEMFEMDSHVGAQELDLQYMKGEQPHCGFPEKLYADNAEKLARKGYRVLVVEQTETPDQLEQRKRETGAKDKVVRREVCAVLTKGTIVDGEMLLTSPDSAYLMSITEVASAASDTAENPDNAVTVGICFVDTSTSQIMLGQFVDDASRSRLRSVLSELRPVELIKPRGILTWATEHAIRDNTRQPLVNILIPGQEFWDAKRSLKEILRLYANFEDKGTPRSAKSASKKRAEVDPPSELQLLPETLQQIVDAGSRGEAALSALGGSIFYLREALLDKTVIKLGRIDLLPGSDSLFVMDSSLSGYAHEAQAKAIRVSQSKGELLQEEREPFMILDAAALENLEIIENNRDGGVSGTLFAYLDSCATPYGRGLLKQWLVRPLMRVEGILQRQQALLDLKNVAADAALNFRKELKSQADMERLLARLHACSGASGRNGENVVLYEDAAKKQLQEFIGALRGCRALILAIKSFESCLPDLASDRLRALVTPGLKVPDMTSVIEHFEAAFDRAEAEKTGRIVPHAGVDEDFDEAHAAVEAAQDRLAEYIAKQRKKFNNSSEINYVTVGKESYQMEIPEKFHAKVPSSYEMRSSRKGFHRYWTPEIKEHLQDLTSGEQQRELALRGILQGLVKRFCEDCSKWLALVKSVAEIDALISLSEASLSSAPTCRPTFVTEGSAPIPKVVAKGIRHPIVCGNLAGGGPFVPNDVALGGAGPPFMLLTGPNMGGKSTLIRQVCLAVVLAQVGANVTADQFELSPVDRVFVRMGAKDLIMAGQSTFLVELSETASMLRSATSRSLVALDELGRGTSTADGQAIAAELLANWVGLRRLLMNNAFAGAELAELEHSVLQHLSHNVGCRGMFSTHYHRLANHFSLDPKVGLHHMSCKVGTGLDGLEEVLFLYKLAAGACPKSYGVNVARLAGMPESVLRRAADRAAELEVLWGQIAHCKSQEPEDGTAAADGVTDNDTTATESEIEQAKEVVALLKKIPNDMEIDASNDTLSQVWLKAKQILQTRSDCKSHPLVPEQAPKFSA